MTMPASRSRSYGSTAWLGAGWASDAAPEAVPALDWLRIGLLTLAGVALAAGLRGPAPVLAVIAAVVGGVCGLAGGLAATGIGGSAIAFAGLWTTVLLLCLLMAALRVWLRRPWMRIALRVAIIHAWKASPARPSAG
jgi:hypothetical protein